MYIKDSRCISPQDTYCEEIDFSKTVSHSGSKYSAIEPKYIGLIPTGQLRRLGKAVRMGVGTGLPLLNENPDVDAMILGSANGGLEDCISFLKQIIDYEEGTLTPTNFIQSTPNAVTGYLAIASKNHCYNNTHVHKGFAFYNALLEAFLMLKLGEAHKALVGTVEEISNYNYVIDGKSGFYKSEETDSSSLLLSHTSGSVCGEGAAMFIVDNDATNASSEIVDMEQCIGNDAAKVEAKVQQLLQRNEIAPADIDALVLGYSGDADTDCYYKNIEQGFDQASVFSFKNLVGEYPSSLSFALWLASSILNGKRYEESAMRLTDRKIRNLLIYNHYRGNEHCFVLMKGVR